MLWHIVWSCNRNHQSLHNHSGNVIMSAMASLITDVSIVFSSVCSGADQRKRQSSALLALCEGNPPVTGGFLSQRASNEDFVFHLMTSSWFLLCACPNTLLRYIILFRVDAHIRYAEWPLPIPKTISYFPQVLTCFSFNVESIYSETKCLLKSTFS